MLHFSVKPSKDGVVFAIVKGVTVPFLKEILLTSVSDHVVRTEILNMDLSKCLPLFTFNNGAKLYINSEIGNFIQGYAWDGRDCLSAMEELKSYYYDFKSRSCYEKSRKIMGYDY